jgi:hypothetical protein
MHSGVTLKDMKGNKKVLVMVNLINIRIFEKK